MALIKLEGLVKDAPVFKGGSVIPIKVESVEILERTELIEWCERENVNYIQNLRESPSVSFGEYTTLPIFRGDRIRAYVVEIGLGVIQDRTAYRIELSDSDGNVKAVYERMMVIGHISREERAYIEELRRIIPTG